MKKYRNKFSEFVSNLSIVNFSTADLMLLRGAPEDRRKWLDMAISQLYPAYQERLSKYNKIRIQKNNFLHLSRYIFVYNFVKNKIIQ